MDGRDELSIYLFRLRRKFGRVQNGMKPNKETEGLEWDPYCLGSTVEKDLSLFRKGTTYTFENLPFSDLLTFIEEAENIKNRLVNEYYNEHEYNESVHVDLIKFQFSVQFLKDMFSENTEIDTLLHNETKMRIEQLENDLEKLENDFKFKETDSEFEKEEIESKIVICGISEILEATDAINKIIFPQNIEDFSDSLEWDYLEVISHQHLESIQELAQLWFSFKLIINSAPSKLFSPQHLDTIQYKSKLNFKNALINLTNFQEKLEISLVSYYCEYLAREEDNDADQVETNELVQDKVEREGVIGTVDSFSISSPLYRMLYILLKKHLSSLKFRDTKESELSGLEENSCTDDTNNVSQQNVLEIFEVMSQLNKLPVHLKLSINVICTNIQEAQTVIKHLSSDFTQKTNIASQQHRAPSHLIHKEPVTKTCNFTYTRLVVLVVFILLLLFIVLHGPIKEPSHFFYHTSPPTDLLPF